MLKIQSEIKQGILFIRLSGILSWRSAFKLEKYIKIVKNYKVKFLILNCLNLKNIDEMGILKLVKLDRMIRDNKGQILMCEVPLELQLNKLNLMILEDEKSAVKMINI